MGRAGGSFKLACGNSKAMNPIRIPAVFMRGGTSKAVMFHRRDLPAEREDWVPIFLAVTGSPDPNGRQLDGMGGGVSSLSKICVIGPSTREDADIDYTFAQVAVKDAKVDFSGNCGNMSSAIGPFAVDEGLVQRADGEAQVRIHNTNTGKVIRSTFEVLGGRARVDGALEIPGVADSGAPVRLDFMEPGGATTGRLLPTGNVTDILDIPELGCIEVSMVDAANACVFVDAAALGLAGTEMPEAIEADSALLRKLAAIREHASVRMGITPDLAAARARPMVPFVGFVSGPQDAHTIGGQAIGRADADRYPRLTLAGNIAHCRSPHRFAAQSLRVSTARWSRAARARTSAIRYGSRCPRACCRSARKSCSKAIRGARCADRSTAPQGGFLTGRCIRGRRSPLLPPPCYPGRATSEVAPKKYRRIESNPPGDRASGLSKAGNCEDLLS